MNTQNLTLNVLDEDLDTLVAVEGGCPECLINLILLACVFYR